MSLIVSEVYDALVEAGTSVEKARAAARLSPLPSAWSRRKNSRIRPAC